MKKPHDPSDTTPNAPASFCAPVCAREPRRPQHARGRRRVDAILDAAAEIIAIEGIAGLTIEAVATRSATSKSSMYHFFPDRDHVLQALIARHMTAIRDRELARLETTVDWASLTVEKVVDRYLEPFLTYMREHPDLVQLMGATGMCGQQSAVDTGLDQLHIEQTERLIAARLPHARPAERRARALAMFAVVVGTISVATSRQATQRATVLRELKHVLTAYLRAIEARAGAAVDRSPTSIAA